jgi:hypothetical protein
MPEKYDYQQVHYFFWKEDCGEEAPQYIFNLILKFAPMGSQT